MHLVTSHIQRHTDIWMATASQYDGCSRPKIHNFYAIKNEKSHFLALHNELSDRERDR